MRWSSSFQQNALQSAFLKNSSILQGLSFRNARMSAETLDVIKAIPTERSSERIVSRSHVPEVAQRAPKRRNMKRNRHHKQSVSDSEDELEAHLRRINLALLS